MPQCDINLAKGIIWNRRVRLRAYWTLMVYVLIMVILLSTVIVTAIKQVQAGTRFYAQSRELQKIFAAQSPGSPNLLVYARQLKEQLDRDAASIASISEALPDDVHSVLPALVLIANQPDTKMLQKLVFTQQSDSDGPLFLFDLAFPEFETRTGSPSQAFIKKWQESPLLAANFPQLRPVRNRRENQSAGPVLITQYEASDKD